jgi:hypothetical protein
VRTVQDSRALSPVRGSEHDDPEAEVEARRACGAGARGAPGAGAPARVRDAVYCAGRRPHAARRAVAGRRVSASRRRTRWAVTAGFPNGPPAGARRAGGGLPRTNGSSPRAPDPRVDGPSRRGHVAELADAAALGRPSTPAERWATASGHPRRGDRPAGPRKSRA